MIRILLVDDQTLLCEVLKTWLEVEDDFEVIGVAHNGNEALSQIESLGPDVVLMDIDMPEMDGLNATKIISEKFPNVKVIFLSGHDEDDYLGKSLRAGAKGYLLKNTTAEELADKVRYVYNNDFSTSLSGDQDEAMVLMQSRLDELIETYRHKFQKQLEASNVVGGAVPEHYENQLQEIKQELATVHSQLSDEDKKINSQMNQQLVNLKKDIDIELEKVLEDWSRQRSALQEWAVQKDEMQLSTEELQSRYRRELMSTINPFRASFRDMDNQMRTMRNWLIGTILLAAMSLTFSSWLIASNFISDETPKTQVRNK